MPKGERRKNRRRREQKISIELPSSQSPFSRFETKTRSNLEQEVQRYPDFSSLPQIAIVSILLKLTVEDVCRSICCCWAFRRAASGSQFWEDYCNRHWGTKTHPSEWIIPPNASRIPDLPQPTNYKHSLSF